MINKHKIINILLIIVMLVSIAIFISLEIKNKGKIKNALPQQETTVPQEVIEAEGNYEQELETMFKYFNDDISKEKYEKFFVRNKGENIRYKCESNPMGACTINEKGKKVFEFPSYDFYPLIQVGKVDIYDEFKGEKVKEEEVCLRLSVTVTNDTDKDAVYRISYKPIGIIKENYSYMEQSTEENHYTDFEDKDNFIFYKGYYDDNNNLLGMFPYEEVPDEIKGPKFLVAANSSKTYYEYYVIPKEWIETGLLAYGDDGLTRERNGGSVNYCTQSFRIMLFPENKPQE